MTVYPTVDAADFFASHKWPLPELNPALDAEIASRRIKQERFDELPILVKQCFAHLDDLQRITHDGCVLDDADIGAIQAKLIILRINLNVHHGVDTEQLGVSWAGSELAEGLGQR